jgi:hypothetical protein
MKQNLKESKKTFDEGIEIAEKLFNKKIMSYLSDIGFNTEDQENIIKQLKNMYGELKEANQYTLGSEFGLDDIVDDVFYDNKDIIHELVSRIEDVYKPLSNIGAVSLVVEAKQMAIELSEILGPISEKWNVDEVLDDFFNAFDTSAYFEEAPLKYDQESIDDILVAPLILWLNELIEFYSSEEYLEDYWAENAYIAWENTFEFSDRGEVPEEVKKSLKENNLTIQDLDDWITNQGKHGFDVKTGVSTSYSSFIDTDEAIVLYSTGDLGESEEQIDGLDDVYNRLSNYQQKQIDKRVEGTFRGNSLYIYLSPTNVTYYIDWDDIKKDFLDEMKYNVGDGGRG